MSDTLAQLSHLTLLYADDDTVLMESMVEIFREYVSHVITATHGEAAWSLYQEHRPDLVILDLAMPGCDGLEVARRICREDPDLPIALMTGHDSRENMLAAFPLRLLSFMVKPVDLETLDQFFRQGADLLARHGRYRMIFESGAVFDPILGEVHDPAGARHILSRNEKKFLELMLARRGQLIDSDRICNEISRDNPDIMSCQGLRNLIHRLRRKLGKDVIVSQKDLGYLIP
ncbi:Transcriptional regulatory protein, C terminal [Geoalkalibacter ferrihydriticus]|uniref:Response regulatory domain-containing protein n=2 Tax=Geoalkalibacter ferrihydriticus TaxID=392333 RepID=A0A0C2DQN1_9BACT|nr:response regulator [Geoalkalibacter ferrihydriticus]KIH75729.1 hypothetical protein GFER_14050 [Geoalkalibacter ferrihydriticus DSM 17813]SDM62446.1 Transcriptional regulatory protein, C terminal [Geoalkalibacter ferrihydriticus]